MVMTPALAKNLFPTEAALCDVFMRDMNALPGWSCYPETGGFDILVAHTSGRQIGVEAKLVLNSKVADQILPNEYEAQYEHEGPDHRVVIVPCITESNQGIARMLGLLGVRVWSPRITWDHKTGNDRPEFNVANELHYDQIVDSDSFVHIGLGHVLFDWNPVVRVALPDMIPDLPAGVPAPVRWTPWKAGALRTLALLRLQGWITAKQIASQGISPSTWTQSWLARGTERGQWVATDKTPFKLAEQHPAEYEAARLFVLAAAEAEKE